MTIHHLSTMINTIPIEVYSGEIVQIWDPNDKRYEWKLYDTSMPKIEYITGGRKLNSCSKFPIEANDTVHSMLNVWLADMPIAFKVEATKNFGLEKYLERLIEEANVDMSFRLNTLKAVLSSAQLMIFADSSRVHNFAGFVIAVREFTETHDDVFEKTPVFVILDEGDTVGISMVADRILELKEKKMEELLVDL